VKCRKPSRRQLVETPSDPPSAGTYGFTSENFGDQTWSWEKHKNADGGRGGNRRFCSVSELSRHPRQTSDMAGPRDQHVVAHIVPPLQCDA
jgi:hypothetical protein